MNDIVNILTVNSTTLQGLSETRLYNGSEVTLLTGTGRVNVQERRTA